MGNADSILIIAPHADDETLGCGGTILKYLSEGCKVYWLLCTEFYRNGKTDENVALRTGQIAAVASVFGFTKTFELGYQAASLTPADIGPLVGKITAIINEIRPTTVFLPNRSDIHTDHQIIFKAAISCTKNFNFPFISQVLMYETISETEFAPAVPESAFIPNVFVKISDHFEKKLEIMQLYKTEVMDSPWPRSLSAIRALAAYRGSSIGENFAEAFVLLKQIVK